MMLLERGLLSFFSFWRASACALRPASPVAGIRCSPVRWPRSGDQSSVRSGRSSHQPQPCGRDPSCSDRRSQGCA
uniref:Uncharacterized protein n=1 Tax=uncultured marine virus TaxID=186617 RepID=A0A0F7L4T1_9VIRU|nr:hypothetical protein [uncultured marine virus]